MAIFSICKQINDPRIDRKRVHSADAIVYIAMAAVICGAESWYEIEDFGNAKIDFFRERLPGLESIPIPFALIPTKNAAVEKKFEKKLSKIFGG